MDMDEPTGILDLNQILSTDHLTKNRKTADLSQKLSKNGFSQFEVLTIESASTNN